MKLKEGQLRRIIREEMSSMTQAPKKRRKGGGPSMWDRIPEDSPDYGRSSDDVTRSDAGEIDNPARLADLLKKATEILLDAQEMCETEPELKQFAKAVSKAENAVHVVLTKVDDDLKGSW